MTNSRLREEEKWGSGEKVAPSDALYSVVILARDAEDTIVACVNSVPVGVPVLVAIDSRSIDTTTDSVPERASSIELDWQGGFGAQRNAAAGLAQSDWIFFLDADEELSEDLNAEILTLLALGPKSAAYTVPRRNQLLGHWMRGGGWWPDRQVRLMNRLEVQFTGVVHETINLPFAMVGQLSHPILHMTHKTIEEVIRRADDYSRLEAENTNARQPTDTECWLLPLCHLFKRYVVLAGFIDGRVGWTEARLQSYYRHLTLRRRRYGPEAGPSPFFSDLANTSTMPNDRTRRGEIALLPSDSLGWALLILLALLPFHLLIKSALPSGIGESWKEVWIFALTVVAALRLKFGIWQALQESWVLKLVCLYIAVTLLTSLENPDANSALQGLHIDLVYVPLVLVVIAIGNGEAFKSLSTSTIAVGTICAVGAVIEVIVRHPLFPSQMLAGQYGSSAVYVSGTHILRPYFTFDFPTGLGTYLALSGLCAAALWLESRRTWLLAVSSLSFVGMMLTFSRGPWIGAAAALVGVVLLVRKTGVPVKIGILAALCIVLLGSGLVAMFSPSAHVQGRVLHESKLVRVVSGAEPQGTQAQSLISGVRVVERRNLPRPTTDTHVNTWTIRGKRFPVLGEPAPASGTARLGLSLPIGTSESLEWGISLNPKVWNPNRGDGVLFGLRIRVAGQYMPIFEQYIDPKNVPADRKVFWYIVPLTGFAGETIRLELFTQSGPNFDADYDWAGWIAPKLVQLSNSVDFSDQRFTPIRQVVEKPVHTDAFYLSSIADWHGDASNSDRVHAWHRTLHAWEQSPIVGQGVGTVDEASLRSDHKDPLITESQIGKVLVESGITGLTVWALLGLLILFVIAVNYRNSGHWGELVVAGCLICISVTGMTFQVLEVKQVAAIFWCLVGLAALVELSAKLSVSGPALAFASVGPGEWFVEPLPHPFEVPAMHVAETPSPKRKPNLARRPVATASRIEQVSEVRLAANQDEANRMLSEGWTLLATGITAEGPAFVLGMVTEPGATD